MAITMRKHYSLNKISKFGNISLIAILCVLHIQCSNAAAVKGGYWYPSPSVGVSDINSTLFTHLFCSFAALTETNTLTIPEECSTFSQIVRQKNPSVKTLLSIGGGNVNSTVFNKTASTTGSRKTFIDSSINLAVKNNFDGLDLDWEQQSEVSEMNNLADLLNEWRAAIKSQAPKLLLTAALNFRPQANPAATFPVQAITDNLDWVNVMAYDLYDQKRSPTTTRAHAALRDPSGDDVSGSSGISAWIQAKVPANKLVLGLPYYGYAWKLVDPNNHGIKAPADGVDGSVGGGSGTASYSEIKNIISQRSAQVVYDKDYVANYCYAGTTWIGFDGLQTVAEKVSYAKSSGLLGYFAWSIGQDTTDWALSNQASQTWGA